MSSEDACLYARVRQTLQWSFNSEELNAERVEAGVINNLPPEAAAKATDLDIHATNHTTSAYGVHWML